MICYATFSVFGTFHLGSYEIIGGPWVSIPLTLKDSTRINYSLLPRCGKNKKKVISGQNISYFTRNSSPTSNTCHMYSSSVYTVYSYAVVKVLLSLSCQMHFFVHNIHATSFPDLLPVCVSLCAFFTFLVVPYPPKAVSCYFWPITQEL